MNKIRLVFVALLVLILVPVALLVHKAVDSAEVERSVKHRAVAERILDEMERELTAFLLREENRPFEHYRTVYVPGDASTQIRSPLAEPPADAFVLGYFEVDSAGVLTHPLDLSALAQPPDPPPVGDPGQRLRLAEEIVSRIWGSSRPSVPAAADKLEVLETAEVDTVEVAAAVPPPPPPVSPIKKETPSPGPAEGKPAFRKLPQERYLDSLNRGADPRTLRQPQVQQTQLANVMLEKQADPQELKQLADRLEAQESTRQEPASVEPALEQEGREAVEGPEPQRRAEGFRSRIQGPAAQEEEAPEERGPATERAAAGDLGSQVEGPPARDAGPAADDSYHRRDEAPLRESRRGRRALAAEPLESNQAETAGSVVDVRLEPMTGRMGDLSRTVLYRTVVADDQLYRQGLVVDAVELLHWLNQRVLVDPELASRVGLGLAGSGDATATPPEAFTYYHRFADPFGSIEAVLHLAPLPELGGSTYLYGLSGLLGLAVSLGLLALYRMVAVRVEYAERRNNFVSAVTHELKTPLTAIRMYGEMLRDGVLPDQAKRQEYYETITSETERLTRLLQNVLDLARLEKDPAAMSVRVGDVGPVVEEVLAILLPQARKQGFELRTEIEEDLPQVRYDRDALVQVLFNLVDNALKYAGKSEPKEVVLNCRRQGGGVILKVMDHGPGVMREHLGKIFEPFYRGENELTRTTKGAGIGLALVRGLVERMGGSVVGENAHAGGFEVTVTLAGEGL